MACYYLVISSTHLSNGHYRSIKGVFRGPLCGSSRGESPDYAEKEKAITKALEDLKANFYCELCDKQYHKHQEFDNHINSYDHAHKQRLKELKQREFARNVSSKSWKDERKQERALKRLHQLALLKQQRDSDKGKNSKLRVPARDHKQERPRLNGCGRTTSRHISSNQGQTGSSFIPDSTSRGSFSTPVPTDQCSHQVHCSSQIPQVPKEHRRPRAGVSFCFSRRAQLKLDSCASVFNDGLDEANELQEHQRQRQRLALQALWSRSPSPTLGQEDQSNPLDPAVLKKHLPDHQDQEESLEIQLNYCTTEPERTNGLDTHDLEFERQTAGPEKRATDQGQRPRKDRTNDKCELIEGKGLRSTSLPADIQSDMAPGQVHTHRVSYQDLQKSRKRDYENVKNGLLQTEIGREDLSSKNLSFLNVLSKDGTTLKWPCELVQYTSDEPRVSYSCNPLCLNFKCAEGKEKSTGTKETDVCAVSGLPDQPDNVEVCAQDVLEDKLGILKPKRTKNRRKLRARRRKLDAVRRHRVGCVLDSQTPARRRFEFTPFKDTPADTLCTEQGCNEKRHKLGKRRRSVRDEVSNESDTPELSLKSIVVNSLSAKARQRRKRQRMPPALRSLKCRAVPPTTVQCTVGSEDNYLWCGNFCETKQDPSVTPYSDKSSSWGVFSDLSSDGEWPTCQWGRCSSSPGSSSSYSWRRGHSQPLSYIRKSSYSFPYDGNRHMSEEDYWDYRDSEICRERNYSGVCDTPCIIERRYSIRKHKKVLEDSRHGYRNRQKLDTKRICFYRIYDSPERRGTEREWWSERTSPDYRRQHREADRFWINSEINQDRGYKRSSPGSRLSPASSSTTSISDLSGDCSSHIKPSYSGRSQNHHSDTTWPEEKSPKTKNSNFPAREKSYSPTPIYIARTETMQTDTQAVISNSTKKQEHVVHSSNSTDSAKQSPSPDQKVTENRTRTRSLPLIGKLPSIKKGIRQTGMYKDKINSCSHQVQTSLNGPLNPENQVVSTAHIAFDNTTHTERNNSNLSQSCPMNTDERSTECCAILQKTDSSLSHENLVRTLSKTSDTSEIHPPKCTTPPLTEQPITFTEEEIDKYRLLQLQAQQHMQQQHLQEQQDMPPQPTPADVPPMNHIPIPAPEHSNQSVLAPCLPYSILQHGVLSAFSSSISTPSSSFASHHNPSAHPLHPSLSQPHFTPYPFPTAFFPVPPTAVLAARPLHLIPAASLHPHPPGLALHPLSQTPLLPTVLAPSPVAAAAAAMAAASTLQIHPLLHPLFHSQDLQNHPGPAS